MAVEGAGAAQEPPGQGQSPKPKRRSRLAPFVKAGAALAGLAGVVTSFAIAGPQQPTGAPPRTTIVTGQVGCPPAGRRPIDVTSMRFQTGTGKTVQAHLRSITTATGRPTHWDHYWADVPVPAGSYVAQVSCGNQLNWTPKMAGTASQTITCGVIDGECSSVSATLDTTSLTQAHPPYQNDEPEPPHTPEPTASPSS